MTDIHDFDDTVVAIVDDGAEAAVEELEASGYHVEVLRGAEGKQHLDPSGGEGGAGATIKRLFNAFADQYRVLDRLHDELDAGRLVVSVEAEPDEAAEAIRILQAHEGEYIWKFGTWTYTRIGD